MGVPHDQKGVGWRGHHKSINQSDTFNQFHMWRQYDSEVALNLTFYQFTTDNWARLPDPLWGGHWQWFPGFHCNGVDQVLEGEILKRNHKNMNKNASSR